MPIIKPEGMLRGERMARLSDEARLYWPFFYAASNGYARFKLDYIQILAKAFSQFIDKPSEDKIVDLLNQYQDADLLFVYEAVNGEVWGAWDSAATQRYYNAEDESSPVPPKDFESWRSGYQKKKQVSKKPVSSLGAKIRGTYTATAEEQDSHESISSTLCSEMAAQTAELLALNTINININNNNINITPNINIGDPSEIEESVEETVFHPPSAVLEAAWVEADVGFNPADHFDEHVWPTYPDEAKGNKTKARVAYISHVALISEREGVLPAQVATLIDAGIAHWKNSALWLIKRQFSHIPTFVTDRMYLERPPTADEELAKRQAIQQITRKATSRNERALAELEKYTAIDQWQRRAS
jgi:hypothetical protein